MRQQGGEGRGPSGESSQPGEGGRGRGTAGGWFGAERRTVLTGFVVAVGFSALAFFVLHAKDKALAGIAANGRTITGVVTSAVELTRSGAKDYQLEYEFKVAGRTYTGTKPVERPDALAAFRGLPLTVTYDTADPTHNIAVPLADARQNTKLASRCAWALAAALWGFAFWKLAATRNGA